MTYVATPKWSMMYNTAVSFPVLYASYCKNIFIGSRLIWTRGSFIGLNIFYSSQNMIKDRAEWKAMFNPLYGPSPGSSIEGCL